MSGLRVLYHATGGGLGHAMRALAVARQMARLAGGQHFLQINTGFAAAFVKAVQSEPGLSLHAFPPQTTPEQVSRDTLALLRDWRPGLLVVDTFPRGVCGELGPVLEGWSGCPRVLISRGLPPAYVERYSLIDFVGRHYDLVLAPGERSPFAELPHFEMLPPFLVRDRDELPGSDAALRLLGSDKPVVLVVGTGSLQECQEWESITRAMAGDWPPGAPPLRFACPPGFAFRRAVRQPPEVQHFPLVECFRGVRLLIGNAGYHLVHETRAAGAAGLFVARRRQYDDQSARISGEERAGDNLLESVLRRLRQPLPPPSGAPNGALLAARAMLQPVL